MATRTQHNEFGGHKIKLLLILSVDWHYIPPDFDPKKLVGKFGKKRSEYINASKLLHIEILFEAGSR